MPCSFSPAHLILGAGVNAHPGLLDLPLHLDLLHGTVGTP
jgi:hypothetical protein